ncbi:MAG: tetratricopeptide repeat protein [Candidatus Eisenbacteria bacterium]
MNKARMDRFARLKELFLSLADLPLQERAPRLDELGRSDPDLRADLDSLMAQSSLTLGIAPVQDIEKLLRSLATDPLDDLPETIGPYRIAGILGAGGMGVVYRAIQVEPIRREVALKVVHRDLDSRRVMDRFDSERQALEMMDHPNIAKVLDAGGDVHGNPYFVMELVPGVPITDYVQTTGLTIRQRLELFRSVCRAAHHAHTKGIIHRDLKPSNILVSTQDGVPVPKVIDFGIAKAIEVMDHGATLTREGHLLGTLAYMSPEQAGAGRVDTRSDIYSLGVILYELLTGTLPHDIRGLPLIESVRVIESERPLPLRGSGERRRRFDPDLETIIGKTLEKAPDRRYGSAAELAEDIDRFLHAQPILARPPSTLYQIQKLAARHKAGVAVAASALVLLATFALLMSIEAGAQRRERARAEAEARKATRVNEFLQQILASANPAVKNVDVRVRDVLDDAVREADFNPLEDPDLESAVRRTIGNTYVALGLYADADVQLRRALELRRGIEPAAPGLVAQSLYDLAECRLSGDRDASNLATADTLSEQALAIRTDLWGPEHPEVTISLFQRARIRRTQGRIPEAESLHTRVLAAREQLLGKSHPDVAQSLTALAWLSPDREKGEAYVRRALEIMRSTYPGDHPDVAFALTDVANFVGSRMSKQAEAESLQTLALEMERRLWGDRHPRTAEAMSLLAVMYSESSRFAEAEPLMRRALEIQTEFHGENSVPAAWAHYGLGKLLGQQGQFRNAEASCNRAVSIFREKLPGSSSLAHSLNALAIVAGPLGKDEEAIHAYREAGQIMESVWGPNHPLVGLTQNNLGTFLVDRSRYAEAEPCFRKALALFQAAYGERNHRTAITCTNLGDALQGMGKLNEAEAMYRKAVAVHEQVDVGDSWSVGRLITSSRLGKCLHYQGRLDEAEDVLRETVRRFRAIAPEHPQAISAQVGFGSLLVDLGKYPEADRTLCGSLEFLEREADTLAGQLSFCRNALAACRAAQGRTAEADSLFRLSTPQAWTASKLSAEARRMARARALRFYQTQGRPDMVARIRSS